MLIVVSIPISDALSIYSHELEFENISLQCQSLLRNWLFLNEHEKKKQLETWAVCASRYEFSGIANAHLIKLVRGPEAKLLRCVYQDLKIFLSRAVLVWIDEGWVHWHSGQQQLKLGKYLVSFLPMREISYLIFKIISSFGPSRPCALKPRHTQSLCPFWAYTTFPTTVRGASAPGVLFLSVTKAFFLSEY